MKFQQAVEKYPSAAFPSSTPLAGSPTRRRGKKSLLIRRDATLRISGALHLPACAKPLRRRQEHF